MANSICNKNSNNISLLNQIIREYRLKIDKERMYENLYYSECSKTLENFNGCIEFKGYNDAIQYEMWSKYSDLFETK